VELHLNRNWKSVVAKLRLLLRVTGRKLLTQETQIRLQNSLGDFWWTEYHSGFLQVFVSSLAILNPPVSHIHATVIWGLDNGRPHLATR
jgi:hypothetical protein